MVRLESVFVFFLGVALVYGRLTINTSSGPCVLPFIYGNVLHYDCLYEHGKAWCSLTANYDRDRRYGWCDATGIKTQMRSWAGNGGGKNCTFPFTFKGTRYTYCFKESVIPWCATTADYDKDGKWGFCAGFTPETQFRPFSSHHIGINGFGAVPALKSEARNEIVRLHNQFRNKVSPTATNMMKMEYDMELEYLARKWADKCKGGHPDVFNLPGLSTVGQNALSSTHQISWTATITAWHNEKQYFTFGKSTTEMIGHYTQVVWAISSMVGCAMKDCDGWFIYICNYAPAANVGSKKFTPYITGAAGDACKTKDATYGKLCDCGSGKSCLNGKAIDPKTCQCPCETGQVGPRCAIDCSTVEDSSHCADTYANYCTRISNVPFMCPKTCGVCPPN